MLLIMLIMLIMLVMLIMLIMLHYVDHVDMLIMLIILMSFFSCHRCVNVSRHTRAPVAPRRLVAAQGMDAYPHISTHITAAVCAGRRLLGGQDESSSRSWRAVAS